MANGQVVKIKVGKQRGRLAEVIASTARAVTVKGSFGVAMYQLSEVEAV